MLSSIFDFGRVHGWRVLTRIAVQWLLFALACVLVFHKLVPMALAAPATLILWLVAEVAEKSKGSERARESTKAMLADALDVAQVEAEEAQAQAVVRREVEVKQGLAEQIHRQLEELGAQDSKGQRLMAHYFGVSRTVSIEPHKKRGELE